LKASSFYLGEGDFQGELYDVSHYPGAIDSSCKTAIVKGDVYGSCNEELLAELDEYEDDYIHEYNKPEFVRVVRNIYMPGQEKLSAWIYLYNLPTDSLRQIPDGDYCKYLENIAPKG
jgi:gamma-glutamylcyclotransferase (GGCT)/AIG2-like uncharacterized protein YtfP